MSIKLIQSKLNKSFLYAKVSKEFIDFLFSFPTLPLGFILKCLQGRTNIGCFGNLYKSIEEFNTMDILKSKECEDLLLSSTLPPSYKYENQILPIEEAIPLKYEPNTAY